MLFGVPDEIPDVTRSLGMVERLIFIYEKSYFGFRKKVQFFRYCTGKLPEGSGGFRRGPEVHKWVHHIPRAGMG